MGCINFFFVNIYMNNFIKIILIIIVLNFLFKNNKVEKFTTEDKRCKDFNDTCEDEGCYWDDDNDDHSKHICRRLLCTDINVERYKTYDDYKNHECPNGKVCTKMMNDLKEDCEWDMNCKWITNQKKCVDKTPKPASVHVSTVAKEEQAKEDTPCLSSGFGPKNSKPGKCKTIGGFENGYGKSFKEIKIASINLQGSEVEKKIKCIEEVEKQYPKANGVTMTSDFSNCYAEFGMFGVDSSGEKGNKYVSTFIKRPNSNKRCTPTNDDYCDFCCNQKQKNEFGMSRSEIKKSNRLCMKTYCWKDSDEFKELDKSIKKHNK